MSLTAEIPHHPMLRHDVAFLQMQDGLLVKAEDNTFKIRGFNAYQYVSALLPFLDGSHRLDDLLDGLSGAHNDTVRSLLGALHARGIVLDRRPSTVELPTGLLDRFRDQVALLGHSGDAHAALHRIATHQVLVVSPDQRAADLMVTSLQDNGFGALGGRLTTHVCGTGRSVGTLPTLEDLDLVVLVSPHARFHGAGELSETAATAGVPLVAVVRVGERVVIGPWQTDQPLLQHAALRMTDNGIPGAAELLLPPTAARARLLPEPELPSGAVDLPVSMCAFEVFKLVSQVMTSELVDGVVFFDPERVETTSETLVPHPLLAEASPPAAWTSVRASGSSADMDERFAAYTPLVNDHVGLARRFHDDDVPQIPVKIGVLAAPVLGADPVLGYSVENVASARVAALDAFAARYSLTVLGRRAPAAVDPDLPPIAPPQVTTVLSPGSEEASWMSATSLDGKPVRLPARAVLTGPDHLRASVYRPTHDGLATGADLTAAREASLLSALRGWTTQQLLAGHLRVTAEQPVDETQDATARLLLTAATTLGAPAQLYRVLDAALPSVLVVTPDVAVLETALTWRDATRSALVEVVGTLQLARHTGRRPTPPQPHLSAGVDAITISTAIPPAVDARSATEAVRGTGLRAAWLDITSPDLGDVARVVRTVLYRDGR